MPTDHQYRIGEAIKTVTVERDGDRFRVTVGDRVYPVAAGQLERGQLSLEVEGRRLRAYVARDGLRRFVAITGQTWTFERVQGQGQRRGPKGAAGQGSLEASMPGVVLDVLVGEGDEVERGQTLVLLEAMKMELRVTAPCAGRVQEVCCVAGEVVERGQLLVELEPFG